MKLQKSLLSLLIALPALCMAGTTIEKTNTNKQQQTQSEPKNKSLHAQFTGQEIGPSGCGLGSIVFGNEKGPIQILAATTNAAFGSQSFGISSGTSNCGASGTHKAQITEFIEINKVSLENDIARGGGENLAALSEVMGCKNQNFYGQIRKNYTPGSSSQELNNAANKSCYLN